MKKKKLWVIAALVLLLSSTFLPMLSTGAQETDGSAIETTTTGSSEQVLETEIQPPEQTTEPTQAAAQAQPMEQSEEPQANAPPQVTEESQPAEEEPVVLAVNQTGKITIRLLDQDNNQLQLGNGAFQLTEVSGKYLSVAWSDLNRDLVYENVPFGNYILEQINPPIGYQLSGFKVTLEIKEGATNFEYTVTNKKNQTSLSSGEIHIISVDDADPNKRLAGACYQLENTATGEVIIDKTEPTNSNGELTIKNLPAGNYRLTKNGSPEGYTGPTVSHSFPLTETEIAENKFPIYTFKYTKQTDIGYATIAYLAKGETTFLAGGEFTLYDVDGKVLEQQTTEQGKLLYFKKLQPGQRYRIKQTKAPAGYELSSAENPLFDKTFEVTYQAYEFRFQVYTSKLPDESAGKVTIKKYTEGDESVMIEGADFTLYDAAGNPLATQTTKAGQALVFNNLAEGTYRIKETKAPTGYQEPNFSEEFTIDDANSSIEYKVFNQRIPTVAKGKVRVQLYAEGAEESTIGGAEFTLYDQKGHAIERKVTVAGKELLFENLELGEYTLRETKIPAGYEQQDIQQSISLNAADSEKTIKLTNKKLSVPKKISISGKARDKSTGTNEGYAQKASTILEEVSYQHAEVGKEYTIKTVLMDPATNQPLVVHGKEVRMEKTFTAKKPNGSMDVAISFDSSSLAGKQAFVFVSLYQRDEEVAISSNSAGSTQTITYPVITTKARGQVVGEKVQIKDTVTYDQLVAGQVYTVEGQLMDQATGLPYQVNGKKITSKSTFTAEKTSGTIDVLFEFERSIMTNAVTLVVFEQLFNNQGSLVASHQDLSDTNQTVRLEAEAAIPAPIKTEDTTRSDIVKWHYSWQKEPIKRTASNKTLPKTGSSQQIAWNVAGGLLLAAGMVIAIRRMKRQH